MSDRETDLVFKKRRIASQGGAPVRVSLPSTHREKAAVIVDFFLGSMSNVVVTSDSADQMPPRDWLIDQCEHLLSVNDHDMDFDNVTGEPK